MVPTLNKLSLYLSKNGFKAESKAVYDLVKIAATDFTALWDELKKAEKKLKKDFKLPSRSREHSVALENSFKAWMGVVSPDSRFYINRFYTDQNNDGRVTINMKTLNSFFGVRPNLQRSQTVNQVTRGYLSRVSSSEAQTPEPPNQQRSNRQMTPEEKEAEEKLQKRLKSREELEVAGKTLGVPYKGTRLKNEQTGQVGRWYVFTRHNATEAINNGPFQSELEAINAVRRIDPKLLEYVNMMASGRVGVDASSVFGPDPTGEKSRAAAQFSGKGGHTELEGIHGTRRDTSLIDFYANNSNSHWRDINDAEAAKKMAPDEREKFLAMTPDERCLYLNKDEPDPAAACRAEEQIHNTMQQGVAAVQQGFGIPFLGGNNK